MSNDRKAVMKRTPPPKELEDEEKERVIEWVKKYHPKMIPTLKLEWTRMRDYYLTKGPQGFQWNWEACFRRWIDRAVRFRNSQYSEPRRGSYERPQENRQSSRTDLEDLKSILSPPSDGKDGD